MPESQNPFEGILPEVEVKELADKKDKLVEGMISHLHSTLKTLLDGPDYIGRDVAKKIALQLMLGELKEKDTMTPNALTPDMISEYIREGKRIILSPVDADPAFMTMEVRNAYSSEINRQEAWYDANKTELLEKKVILEGQHSLICNCEVVATDPDIAVIIKHRDSKYPNREDTLIIMNVTKNA